MTRYASKVLSPVSTGNKLRWMHWSPNRTESIRHPYFAQGYPKGKRLLSISFPVEAGDILSLRHPPKLLRVRASCFWSLNILNNFWSPGIKERECLHAVHYPEARCGTLWMMWPVHSLGKTTLRSGFSEQLSWNFYAEATQKFWLPWQSLWGRTNCKRGCNSN